MKRHIDPEKWYTVREIIDRRFLSSLFGRPIPRQFIYKLIEQGRLKARNLSIGATGSRYWVISGRILIKFIKGHEGS